MIITKNIGADVWPFVHVLSLVNLDDYDFVVKVHTKRDMNIKFRLPTGFLVSGNIWRETLLSFLQPNNFAKCISKFNRHKTLGMACNHKVILFSFTKNPQDKITDNMTQKLLGGGGEKNHISYCAGTMFLARAKPFCIVKELNFQESDFVKFTSNITGQTAHVLEQFFGSSFIKQGCKIKDPFTNRLKQIIFFLANTAPLYIINSKRYKFFKIIKFIGMPLIFIPRTSFFSMLKNRIKFLLINKTKFLNYILNQQQDKSNFITITKTPLKKKPSKKLIAYYLPQYYQIKQNDEWYGTGFTEWTNTSQAVPQFVGHWQPHIPIDTGYYNLETTHTMHRQVELAKMYGIYGFCFYYYWFHDGERIMEKPVNNFLADKTIDFPFMLFWANEDWTNTWGDKGDINTKTWSAKTTKSDVEKFADSIIPFFNDPRYIKVNGQPHLIIYRSDADINLPQFIEDFQNLLESRGMKRAHISIVRPTNSDPRTIGADSAVEFSIHQRGDIFSKRIKQSVTNPLAKINFYDMKSFVTGNKFQTVSEYPVYKSPIINFDNTARKIYTGASIFHVTPELYKKWLSELIKTTDRDTIFLSSWNEWAEGQHLEPDKKYGYAYLQATKEALEEST
ncbi:MAG: glycoside hydrolase family 99-like domain-containing protein [Rickettsiales bacterium]|nr:glycoside hydrolase family 99-like domain-containing protein [Rickettsiales bacterium]